MRVNVLVDSCGWIEYFTKGTLADKYQPYIINATKQTHFTPTIVLYEVYKLVKREFDERLALEACARIKAYTTTVPIDEELALAAADLSTKHRLSMADAMIITSAERHRARVVTSDKHLGKLKGVELIVQR